MKVCYDHQIFSWQRYGGISRYFCEVAKSLQSKAAIDVDIVSPIYVNEYLNYISDEVPVTGIFVKKLPKVASLIRILNSVVVKPMANKLKPDVFHETYYSELALAPKTAKTLITVHDLIQEKFPDLCRGAEHAIKSKSMAIERADHIICVSENTRQDLIKIYSVDPKKTSVVYHGVSLDVEDSCSLSAMPDKPYFLYVGDRFGYKNFSAVVKAIAQSKILRDECKIVCVGGGAFSNTELNFFDKFGFRPGQLVQVSGDDKLLVDAYKNALAFVYPSLYEGFGIPLLEAMNLRCPVLCANTSSIPEVVGDSGLYFDPKSVVELGVQMERVLLDTSLRNVLVKNGIDRAKKFSWDKCADETRLVYEKVLGS